MRIPSTRPWFDSADIVAISREISEILESGILILGPHTYNFEEAFSNYCGVAYSVAVSSCTAALEIALRYIDVQNKDVIVPTNTFVTTANAVIESGGNLVLADIKPDTLCLDPAELRRCLSPRTGAVILVHIAGLPCPDIEEIRSICEDNCLILIEDASHAHGATIRGRKTGSLGYAGCFSFYATKVMTTGIGGMLTTNDGELAEYARCLRRYGATGDLNYIINMGNDWIMGEINALIGIYQLRALEANLARRNEIALAYKYCLDESDSFEFFEIPPQIRHSFYRFPILLSRTIDKERLVTMMKADYGIGLGSVYDPPVHLQPVYRRLFGYGPGMFPVAEEILPRTCCLPIFPTMTDEDVEYVTRSLWAALAVSKKGVMEPT